MFDLAAPLTIAAVAERSSGVWVFTLRSVGAELDAVWTFGETEVDYLVTWEPTPETAAALGEVGTAVSFRTYLSPWMVHVRNGDAVRFPVELPGWWMGKPGWPGW